jgi:uncharacterized membrane protein (DUF4010 family)
MRARSERRVDARAPAATEGVARFALSIGAPAGLLAAAVFVPRPLVLPLFSGVLVVLAFALAFAAWLRAERHDGRSITTWDVAGLLAFLGGCAAMLGDPEEAIALLQPTAPAKAD